MKKYASVTLCLLLAVLCGCENSTAETRFLFDTVVTLTADCDSDTLSGAFELCEKYEKMLSAHRADSEISVLNESGKANLSADTAYVISEGLRYGDISGGRFDITVYPLTLLWNFKEEIVPSRDEIAAALENVDYHSVKVNGTLVETGGAKIDLGGIAKGYITDKLFEYFDEKGVNAGIINLGGNILVFGDRKYKVGIQKPFSENENAAVIKLKNKAVSTSGVYQRYFEKNGVTYHHIIDPESGESAKSDLLSATVICGRSLDADALSTICILKGKKDAAAFIEALPHTEAIFIDADFNLTYTGGIKKSGNYLISDK